MIRKLILILAIAGLWACQSQPKKETTPATETPVANIELTMKVEGMTCDHCEMSIQKGVSELPGIESVVANFEDSTTMVRFNPSLTSEDKIKEAIEKRGYQVKK